MKLLASSPCVLKSIVAAWTGTAEPVVRLIANPATDSPQSRRAFNVENMANPWVITRKVQFSSATSLRAANYEGGDTDKTKDRRPGVGKIEPGRVGGVPVGVTAGDMCGHAMEPHIPCRSRHWLGPWRLSSYR